MHEGEVEGLRVLRGPDWEKGDEDGGEGYLGTVTSLLGNGQVLVVWDMGHQSTCRTGQEGRHDLRIWDSATVGIHHPGTQCFECEEKDIFGTLWRCQDCEGCDLCSHCYCDDRHDLSHHFLRIDTPGGQGQKMQKRKSSVKVRTIGLHPGAKVVRGTHWQWGDQDGGEGSEGEVKDFVKVETAGSIRNLVQVEWPNGASNTYRLGFHGSVDLKCVEEETGMFYYRDHLLLLDTTKSLMASQGESQGQAKGVVTPPTSGNPTAASANHPEGSKPPVVSRTSNLADPSTSSSLGATSNCTKDPRSKLTSEQGATNGSSGYVTSDEGKITSRIQEKEEEELPLSVGDRAAIKVGEEKLKALQEAWGGCTARMIRCIGRTGEVTAIAANGMVSVRFGDAKVSYRFNPHVLIKVDGKLTEGCKVRVRSDGELQKVLNATVGWTAEKEQALGKVGRVTKVDKDTGDLRVNFNGCHLTFSLAACILVAADAVVDTLSGGEDAGGTGSGDGGACAGGNSFSTNTIDPGNLAVYQQLHDLITGRSSKGQGRSMSLLYAAIEFGDEDKIREMCRENPGMINGEHKGITPLIYAALRGQRRCMLTLLDLGADVNKTPAEDNRRTPLVGCLEGKSEEIADILLARGASTTHLYGDGHTAAHLAVLKNKVVVLKALAEYGADLNVKDERGDTPLHMAIELSRQSAIELLVGLPQVNIHIGNARDFDMVQLCCYEDNPRVLEKLLARDNSQLERLSNGRSPAIHIAATNNNVECIRLLVINGGADVNVRGKIMDTALHKACHRAQLQSAEALMELGADVNVKDRDGDTPLHLAIGGSIKDYGKDERAQVEVAYRIQISTLLITRGAYVDAVNNKGRHPFQYGVHEVRSGIKAFMNHNPDIVQMHSRTQKVNTLLQSMGVSLLATKRQGLLKEALQGVSLPCGKCGKDSDVTLEPCRHKCVCSSCSKDVVTCPLCDEFVKGKVEGDVSGK